MYACVRVVFLTVGCCRLRLEKEAEELSKCDEVDSDRLQDVYERLEDLDAATAEPKASRILHGLGRIFRNSREA